MTIYTVHLPTEPADDSMSRLMKLELVKDGFHWLALIFPLLWLLFNRIWWGLLAYIVLVIAVLFGGKALGLDDGTIGALELLMGVFLGLVASDLKSWQLARRGLPTVDVVSGTTKEEAERRFLDRWNAATGSTAAAPPRAPSPPARPLAGQIVGSTAGQPVLGLFPESGGAR